MARRRLASAGPTGGDDKSGHGTRQIQRAIKQRNLFAAELAARELRGPSLHDALDLVALIAQARRYGGALLRPRFRGSLDRSRTPSLARGASTLRVPAQARNSCQNRWNPLETSQNGAMVGNLVRQPRSARPRALGGPTARTHDPVAMHKVVGSSAIIRSQKAPLTRGFSQGDD
jgi:hypothetical protein